MVSGVAHKEEAMGKIGKALAWVFDSPICATVVGTLVLAGLLAPYHSFAKPPSIGTLTSLMTDEATSAQAHDISVAARIQGSAAETVDIRDLRYAPTAVLAPVLRPAQMPFAVYTDGGAPGNHYVPSGYMGDYRAVTMNQYWTGHPHHGRTCIRVTYRGAVPGGVGWAGVYWQSPANNWGTVPGLAGYDLSRAGRLTFWVRGTTGAERVQFLVGGITGRYGDSLRPAVKTPVLRLSTAWQRVTITLTGRDLTHIIGGFGWVASAKNDPRGVIFYLDDIVYSA